MNDVLQVVEIIEGLKKPIISNATVKGAIEILERQIPKKPINKTSEYNGDYGGCPCCGRCVSDFHDGNRCPDCGQVLNWG